MINNIKRIFTLVKSHGKHRFVNPATEAQVMDFELMHYIVLLSCYKEWLFLSDGSECFLPAGIQLYGVEHSPIIDVSDDDRLDDTYIVIGRLASGDPICFKIGEEKIVIYNHSCDCIEEDEIYENFGVFMEEMLKEM